MIQCQGLEERVFGEEKTVDISCSGFSRSWRYPGLERARNCLDGEIEDYEYLLLSRAKESFS